jgi:hypothetical protein
MDENGEHTRYFLKATQNKQKHVNNNNNNGLSIPREVNVRSMKLFELAMNLLLQSTTFHTLNAHRKLGNVLGRNFDLSIAITRGINRTYLVDSLVMFRWQVLLVQAP